MVKETKKEDDRPTHSDVEQESLFMDKFSKQQQSRNTSISIFLSK